MQWKKLCDFFIAMFALLQWCGTEFTITARCVFIDIRSGVSRQPTKLAYLQCAHDSLQEQICIEHNR